jgi:two-component system, cell cycle response regulator
MYIFGIPIELGDRMDIFEKEALYERNWYKQLFCAAEKLHAFLDNDKIYEELVTTLEEVFPEYTYYLLLPHDHKTSGNLPIIEVEFKRKNTYVMEAYLFGNIQFGLSADKSESIMYAPLKGKQGIYGVLQLIAPKQLEFSIPQIEFITSLALSAGSALENAMLYQKSRQAISNLKLINETSQRLNSNLQFSETMNYISEQIRHAVHVQEVGFFLFSSEQELKLLPGSSAFFSTSQAEFYTDYIKNKIIQENDAVFIGDINLPNLHESLPFRSIMAVPISQNKRVNGFSVVLQEEPYAFSFDSFNLLKGLIYHSSLALANTKLREELETLIITDHLTKLHSRNYLDEGIKRSMKEDDEGTFMLIDIDNFKEINDTYGHQVGDEVLIQVAELIKSNIRTSDIGARWGGEELAVYLPRVSLETGAIIAERIVEKIAECSSPKITVSCGVSYWTKERFDTFKYLFKRADEALYQAKGTGKNKMVTQNHNIIAS